ncbi:MAG: hypothetical protein RSC41_05665 [Oscillospiraceae bacterium]
MQNSILENIKKVVVCLVIFIMSALLFLFSSQIIFAHRNAYFSPDYEKEDITHLLDKTTMEKQDYETLFLQTGLWKSAIDTLKQTDNDYKQTIEQYQNMFFAEKNIRCNAMLGIFTREDVLVNNLNLVDLSFVDVRAGDIVVTTATHSAGWRHGHSALVLENDATLESTVLGSNSSVSTLGSWKSYSNWAILRVKNSSKIQGERVAEYAYENLLDIPYRLSSGLFGEKSAQLDAPNFGLHCGYLVWYAWQLQGIDLDSDGGRIVTPTDILYSKNLEVVQLFGMDPRNFI